MKKYEVTRIGPLSFFKAFFYILLVPLAIYLLLGMIVLVTGLVTQDDLFVSDGLTYFINSVIAVLVYGLVSIIAPSVYNVLAKRFGGLQLILDEKDSSK